MRVGLLEDDVSIQEMLCLVLQDEGHQVIVFSNSEACLEALGVTEPKAVPLPVDVMIVDWRLSGAMTGTDVIHQIRRQPNLDTLPIILTTAATYNNTEELQRLKIVFLEKPFAVDDIIALIQQLTQPHSTP
jgi:DNA-binding response OmpR family regulator